MIGYLTGKIISVKPTRVLLDVNGVGYLVNISISTYEKIAEKKDRISLYTYLSVKEDSLDLYGFSLSSEKEMFELLISVSGVGPKLALGILSGIQIDVLQEALKTGNVSRLIAIPGIGRKTAERLVVELRDKVDLKLETDGGEVGRQFELKNDAAAALTQLGYNQKTAEQMVRKIILDNPSVTLEDLIKNALSTLNK